MTRNMRPKLPGGYIRSSKHGKTQRSFVLPVAISRQLDENQIFEIKLTEDGIHFMFVELSDNLPDWMKNV